MTVQELINILQKQAQKGLGGDVSRYEFQSTLHRNPREMHQHMAHAYMYAGGLNNNDDIRQFFSEQTDEQLADDAIANWALTDNPDFDRGDFIAALAEFRKRLGVPHDSGEGEFEG